jgi:hypothetical protein
MELYSECKSFRNSLVGTSSNNNQNEMDSASSKDKERDPSRTISSSSTSTTATTSSNVSSNVSNVTTDGRFMGTQGPRPISISKTNSASLDNDATPLPGEYDNFQIESAELSSSVVNWKRINKSASSVSTTTNESSNSEANQAGTSPKTTSKPLDMKRFSMKKLNPFGSSSADSNPPSAGHDANISASTDSAEPSHDDDKIVITGDASHSSTLGNAFSNAAEDSEAEAHHAEFYEVCPNPYFGVIVAVTIYCVVCSDCSCSGRRISR